MCSMDHEVTSIFQFHMIVFALKHVDTFIWWFYGAIKQILEVCIEMRQRGILEKTI